ncbi:hypothetical protein GCM10009092_17440 [Bowmanella denitrificans]|uniref:DUF2304 domain-containing protein n=1 Tax=Bowmanella denitrificans TaxID=366582 RepID=A0ABN0X3D1_9ALTE
MNTPQLISALISLAIGISIIVLIRRDHLMHRDGIKWMLIACLILVAGIFPSWVDVLGQYLKIGYPPIIPVLVGMGVILIKLLLADIERARMQVTINRLVQRLAIIEAEQSHSQQSL